MEYIITAQQMRQIENHIMNTVGMDAVVLMERAALSAARVLKKMTDKESRILIVCGFGNNGADGLALARILFEKGYMPEVLLLGDEEKRSILCRRQEQILRMILGETQETYISSSLTDTKARRGEYAVIVDAILGIGASRPLSGELLEAVEWMNGLQGRKLALDVPTGICSDTGRMLTSAFCADVTVTFGMKKQGLFLGRGKVCAGKVLLDSCGMNYPYMLQKQERNAEKQTFLLNQKSVSSYLKRDLNGNKSTFGKIGMISGSSQIAGAAILGVLGAFRSGGGYVRLCTHENNKESVLAAVPETVLDLYLEVTEAVQLRQKVKAMTDFADVILAGSGLGMSQQSEVLLTELLLWAGTDDAERKPLIFDADALNLIAEKPEIKTLFEQRKTRVILTPHIMEFSRISGMDVQEIKKNRIETARSFAMKNNCILVLKDAQTVVADEMGNVFVSDQGNDGMAVAGSGDVLAGIIGGMCGQIKDPYISACVGVYIHGMAGDIAASKLGAHSMMPTDLINGLKKCMKKLGKEAEKHEAI